MYSLLNYIAATSRTSSSASAVSMSSLAIPDDHETVQSLASGMQVWSEEQRRLVAIATISVVTRLALEFRVQEVCLTMQFNHSPLIWTQVTRLTISMLLQRLRGAEPTVEAAIAYNLVSLALVAPSGVVSDVFRALSAINRSANEEDPSYSSNTVRFSLTHTIIRLITCRFWLLKPVLRKRCTLGQSCTRLT